MTKDFKALAAKLSRPWWGPHPPERYVMQLKGRTAGVGLIVGYDYGAWNLALLARGSYQVPETYEEQTSLLADFVKAKKIAEAEVLGHPLGSYAMLMNLAEFRNWLACAPAHALGETRMSLRRLTTQLLRAPIA